AARGAPQVFDISKQGMPQKLAEFVVSFQICVTHSIFPFSLAGISFCQYHQCQQIGFLDFQVENTWKRL
ncbi:MAG: hypothetical protein ACTIKY_10200, partial [Corynebacterium casei]|uniref:hypothetical protein n=1 Tax=Corynebacterium casei TaxID=160386 RepID=UPI003F9C53D8